jgi:hypothetical protein
VSWLHFHCSSSWYIRILVLHPRHKLAYFKNAGWEDEWVNSAERIVHMEYERSYAHLGRAANDEEHADNDNEREDVRLIFSR